MKNLKIAMTVSLLALSIGVPFVQAQSTVSDDPVQNIRERGDATLTPMDTGNETDSTITQEIRKAIEGQGGLSSNARNVKIATVDGVVTLQGPVKSADEKMTIGALARDVEGVKGIDDQLEVERNP